jgi:hypothetical protein
VASYELPDEGSTGKAAGVSDSGGRPFFATARCCTTGVGTIVSARESVLEDPDPEAHGVFHCCWRNADCS